MSGMAARRWFGFEAVHCSAVVRVSRRMVRVSPGIRTTMTLPQETAGTVLAKGVWMFARCWPGPRDGGVDVVLVHGLGVASQMCRPAASLLARRHQVWAPDLPGFGESQRAGVPSIDDHADYVAAWTEAVGVSRPVVVGTSFGCQVAASLAQRHPDCCRILVLGSPTVDAERRGWLRQLVRWPAERHSRQLTALIVKDFARAGIPRVMRTFSTALDDRIEDRLPELDQMVLVCWGDRDPLLSRRWTERLASLPPNGRLAVLPGARHALSHESPLQFARVIEHFIDEAG